MKVIASLKGGWALRISKEGEQEGLDIVEHGTTAYHLEFGQGAMYTAPGGFPSEKSSIGSKATPADTSV
jgi:hypothetical protein